MNADVFQGMWKQIRGEVKKQWGNLTDDDLDKIDGQRDKFVGALAGAVWLGQGPSRIRA